MGHQELSGTRSTKQEGVITDPAENLPFIPEVLLNASEEELHEQWEDVVAERRRQHDKSIMDPKFISSLEDQQFLIECAMDQSSRRKQKNQIAELVGFNF